MKLVQNIPLISLALIAAAALNQYFYYINFGINILPYLTPSELLLSISEIVIFVGGFLFASFTHRFTMKYDVISLGIEVAKSPVHGIKTEIYQRIAVAFCGFLIVCLGLVASRVSDNNINYDYLILLGFALLVTVMMQLAFILSYNLFHFDHVDENIVKYGPLYGGLIIVLLFAGFIKSQNHKFGPEGRAQFATTEGMVIRSGKSLVYAGKTEKYLIMYNKILKLPMVYNRRYITRETLEKAADNFIYEFIIALILVEIFSLTSAYSIDKYMMAKWREQRAGRAIGKTSRIEGGKQG